ncbi:hypothetical protein LT337_15620 [Mycolicibacterium fortuitum]|nr:hypothetical protein LT337_15620 [Mycolicibacterium fortuitum]
MVVQWGDGTIATEGDDAPLVYINASSYSPDEARTIAEGIRKVADQVDRWAGRFPELDKLVEARAALLEMYNKTRRVPDVRTDCLRGSLDSITDLIDAMKREAQQ